MKKRTVHRRSNGYVWRCAVVRTPNRLDIVVVVIGMACEDRKAMATSVFNGTILAIVYVAYTPPLGANLQ
jgi:hypothetical protein